MRVQQTRVDGPPWDPGPDRERDAGHSMKMGVDVKSAIKRLIYAARE